MSAFTSAKIDKIVELQPDLVLGFSDLQADIAAELIRAGIEVHVFNQRSVAEILRMIAMLGGMVGCEAKARALDRRTRGRHRSGARRAPRSFARRPRVYFEEWDEPQISGIRWVSELIGIAGGDDCFPELARESLGKNRIIADPLEVPRRAPDVIFGSWCGKKFRPEHVAARAGWGEVPAVRDGHLYEIKSSIILQPGPAALTDGLARMHAHLATWRSVRPVRRLSASRYLALRPGDDFRRQLRPRRLLVPVERLEIVAHELLVERRRAGAFALGVGGPEARGIRRQHFVDEHQRAVRRPCANSNLVSAMMMPRSARMFAANSYKRDGRIAHARGKVGAHELRGLLEADGFVLVADGRLGGRREQRLRQLRRLPEPGG